MGATSRPSVRSSLEVRRSACDMDRYGGCRTACLGVGLLFLTALAPHARAQVTSTASSNETTAGAGSESQEDPPLQRLDPRVRPLLYQLQLKTFLGEGTNFSFLGNVNITFRLQDGARGDIVVFHIRGLNISTEGVTIRPLNNNSAATAVHSVVSQALDAALETYTLGVSPPLRPGRDYRLAIPFSGRLLEPITGFYRTSYVEGGRTKWLAMTHFEAIDARSAFPCFDEPRLKARFQISLSHASNYSAHSNMPLVRSEPLVGEPGWTVDHFDTSPVMSTYLVAFVISEMVYVTADDFAPSSAAPGQSVPTTAYTESTNISTATSQNTKVQKRNSRSHSRAWDSQADGESPVTCSHNGQKKRHRNAIVPTNSTAPLKIRILVRPEVREQAKYVLTVVPKVLNFYADYYGEPYPLPKLDCSAILDFFYGGMENWGAVIYWERRALIGPETSSDSWQEGTRTIVHELGHQWFGDLVTPSWWSETWLREGFATYLEFLATDVVEPTWEMLDKFPIEMHTIMLQDSVNTTHPMSTTVETLTQLVTAFDSLAYTKGACLFRMLNHTLTAPVFKRGLQIFIKKWKYLNVDHNDLWWSMDQAAREQHGHKRTLPSRTTVKQVMDSWTLQAGFPVVTVTRDYARGSVTVDQARFTLDGSPAANGSSQAWYVPISYVTQDEIRTGGASTTPRVWLGTTGQRRSLTIDGVFNRGSRGAGKWLLLNLQQTGYYKVNYDVENWKLLSQQLVASPQVLPTASRAQLVSDALSLARADSLPYGVALNVTLYLRGACAEVSLVPWQAFLDGVTVLQLGLSLTETNGPLGRYMRALLEPLIDCLKMLPQPTDTLSTKQLRALAVSRIIWVDANSITARAQSLFTLWMATSDQSLITVDLRPSIYCSAVRLGGEAEFNFTMTQFLSNTVRTQRNDLLSALMCSQQPANIAMLLNAPLEGIIMGVDDTPTVWQAVSRNPVARPIAFDYLRQQWTNLTQRFPNTDTPLTDILQGATAGLSTQEQLDDLIAFKASHEGEFTQTSATIDGAIASLQERVSWKQRFQLDIAAWLRSPGGVSR